VIGGTEQFIDGSFGDGSETRRMSAIGPRWSGLRSILAFRFACPTRQGIGLAAFKNGFDNARREQRKTHDATEVELVDALGRHVPPAMGARPEIHVSIRRLATVIAKLPSESRLGS
jgi:hypothetical protein